jgi:hypothetical protein
MLDLLLPSFFATAANDRSGPMFKYSLKAANAFAVSRGCRSNTIAIIILSL